MCVVLRIAVSDDGKAATFSAALEEEEGEEEVVEEEEVEVEEEEDEEEEEDDDGCDCFRLRLVGADTAGSDEFTLDSNPRVKSLWPLSSSSSSSASDGDCCLD